MLFFAYDNLMETAQLSRALHNYHTDARANGDATAPPRPSTSAVYPLAVAKLENFHWFINTKGRANISPTPSKEVNPANGAILPAYPQHTDAAPSERKRRHEGDTFSRSSRIQDPNPFMPQYDVPNNHAWQRGGRSASRTGGRVGRQVRYPANDVWGILYELPAAEAAPLDSVNDFDRTKAGPLRPNEGDLARLRPQQQGQNARNRLLLQVRVEQILMGNRRRQVAFAETQDGISANPNGQAKRTRLSRGSLCTAVVYRDEVHLDPGCLVEVFRRRMQTAINQAVSYGLNHHWAKWAYVPWGLEVPWITNETEGCDGRRQRPTVETPRYRHEHRYPRASRPRRRTSRDDRIEGSDSDSSSAGWRPPIISLRSPGSIHISMPRRDRKSR